MDSTINHIPCISSYCFIDMVMSYQPPFILVFPNLTTYFFPIENSIYVPWISVKYPSWSNMDIMNHSCGYQQEKQMDIMNTHEPYL